MRALASRAAEPSVILTLIKKDREEAHDRAGLRAGRDTIVGTNFILADGELRLAGKQVLQVNRDQPLPAPAFLI